MAEPAIKSDRAEAARLFERGVAAARGGQRRVAAGLLSRAVQFDPRHEQAWLWLSGVLDSPEEIAFCLRSVLTLNPDNERARQGLAWLEQRGQLAAQPVQTTPLAARAAAPEKPEEPRPWWSFGRGPARSARQRPAPAEREHWWAGLRYSRREVGQVWMMVWLILILLWGLLLGLHQSMVQTIERNIAQAQAEARADLVVVAAPKGQPGQPQLLKRQLEVAQRAEVLAYLSTIHQPREDLRKAVQLYRDATQQPGSSVSHAASARTLRDQIEASYKTISAISPPAPLKTAHAAYLSGLEQERAAMGDLLEFYGSFSIQLSNRAILRLMEADKQMEQARTSFAQEQGLANQWFPPAQTLR